MIIDFHTHLDESWIGNKLMPEQTFLDLMNRYEVEVACIFTLEGFYGNCSMHNDNLAERARRNPQRLVPFATVNPKLGDQAVNELERCLANPLFRGVKFHTWLQAIAPSMVKETMIKLLKCAAKHNVPVIFHDGTPPYATTFQIAALARWVPAAKIILGHSGLSDYIVAAGQLAGELDNLYLCLTGPKSGEIKFLADTAGVDKMVFGSDLGFSDWRMLPECIDYVLQSGLHPQSISKIFYSNAVDLLDLKRRPL
ncbi:MAG: hypothetical protein DHS20C17_00840 [Cyclobacteriaceae bacterium]|nr:MAG: hypothetical protein DHS20C17_00840 [Cyclobacteriaceae bacterium]